jgi:hypothetical protein
MKRHHSGKPASNRTGFSKDRHDRYNAENNAFAALPMGRTRVLTNPFPALTFPAIGEIIVTVPKFSEAPCYPHVARWPRS